MGNNTSSKNNEFDNTSDNDDQLLRSEYSTEDSDNSDTSEEESSIINIDEALDEINKQISETENDDAFSSEDLLNNILNDQYQESQLLHTDESDLVTSIDDISSERIDQNSSNKDNDDEEDIEDLLKNILGDQYEEIQSPHIDTNDSETSIDDTISEMMNQNTTDIESADEKDIEDLLKDILGDEYKEIQSKRNNARNSITSTDTNTADELNRNNPDNNNDDEKIVEDQLNNDFIGHEQNGKTENNIIDEYAYLLNPEVGTSSQLDEKIFNVEKLWNELSTTWHVINEQPDIKIKIEELWDELKKDGHDDFYIESLPDNRHSIFPATSRDETETDEINRILGYDINSVSKSTEENDKIQDEYNPYLNNDLDGLDSSNNTEEPEIITPYSVSQDFDFQDTDEDNPDVTNVSLSQLILDDENSYDNKTQTTIDPDIESYNEKELLESTDSEKLLQSILNGTVTDEQISSDHSEDAESKPIETHDLVDFSSADEPEANPETEVNDQFIEEQYTSLTEIDSAKDETYSSNSIEDNETRDTSNKIEALNESTDTDLNNSAKEHNTEPSSFIKKQIENEQFDEKITLSRVPIPDYTTTLDKSSTSRTYDTYKNKKPAIKQRETGRSIVIAATLGAIAIGVWLYLNKGEIEKETNTNTTNIIIREQSALPSYQDQDNTLQQNKILEPDDSDNSSDKFNNMAEEHATPEEYNTAEEYTSPEAYVTPEEHAAAPEDNNSIEHHPADIVAGTEAQPEATEHAESKTVSPDFYNNEPSLNTTNTSQVNDIEEDQVNSITNETLDNTNNSKITSPEEFIPIETAVSQQNEQAESSKISQAEMAFQSSTEDDSFANKTDDEVIIQTDLDMAEAETTIEFTSTTETEKKYNIIDSNELEPVQSFVSNNSNTTSENPINAKETIINSKISTTGKSHYWALNLSSIYKTEDPAMEVIELLHSKNIPAEIKHIVIADSVWYRIRIRGFDSKQQALDYMTVIRKHTRIKKYWISKITPDPGIEE